MNVLFFGMIYFAGLMWSFSSFPEFIAESHHHVKAWRVYRHRVRVFVKRLHELAGLVHVVPDSNLKENSILNILNINYFKHFIFNIFSTELYHFLKWFLRI